MYIVIKPAIFKPYFDINWFIENWVLSGDEIDVVIAVIV